MTPRCEQRLQGVHKDLQLVVYRADELLHGDLKFIVTEGLRTPEKQAHLVKVGASRTMNSRHLTGHAVDLAAWIDDGDGTPEAGEIRWDWPLYQRLADVMKRAADELGVKIVWGGDWRTFKDGPHFELDRRLYA